MNGVYTLLVSNVGGTASSGQITVNDELTTTGLVFVSATGTGWSCVVRAHQPPNGDFVLCNSSSVVAAGGSAFPITLTVRPSYSGTVTNTACVAGSCTGDPTIVTAAVPTLPEWAMFVLTGLLALAGVAAMRRRTT
jgi:hypothetical protein